MREKPDIMAVITARGNSKSVPRKNIAAVGGKPLIAWTIEAAHGAPSLKRVIVSTDDNEIAEVAKEWGAEVPFLRPPELARDDSSHVPVVIHALQWMKSRGGRHPDCVLLLQPTLPLRSRDDIENAVQLLLEKEADSVVSVCEASCHPYLTRQITPEGKLFDFIETPKGYLARQKLPKVYALNGAIYLVRRDVLINQQKMYTDYTYAYVMPLERSLDIDTPWDLYLADLILRDRQRNASD
jgi:N-acylneuraminate cytidylyltransferase/CMP-N,N'-diacetyllegionaminic acid synthase